MMPVHYYSALNRGELYRVRAADLTDRQGYDIASRVQRIADITMSDGMTMDAEGRVYLTDMEHSQVVRVDRTGHLEVLLRDARLRWPDGFAWSPDGRALYVSASALHQFLPKLIATNADIEKNAPYQIFRLPLD